MSLHKIAVPTFVQLLDSMQTILDKAAAHCESHNLDPNSLLQARLYPDMFPLARQVQAVADHACAVTLRLCGQEPTTPPRNETSFQALKQRIVAARATVAAASAEAMDANADREVVFGVGSRQASMTGWNYLVHYGLPNFYFHHTTAYAILRHNGVEIGKRDFLGAPPGFNLR